MNIRGIGDAYALRRLLWLLVGTVIVPTVLLSLFGVMAIRNQRAAILQRLDRDRADRLEIGARALQAEIDAFEAELRRRDPPPAIADPRWGWDDGTPPPPDLAGLDLDRSADQVQWLTPPEGPPVAVWRDAEGWVAWGIQPVHLMAAVTDRADLPQQTRLTLQEPARTRTWSMEDAIARLSQASGADLSLPGPLAGWRLVVQEDDPTRAVLRRSAWVYPLSLVVLVALVVVGAIVTLVAVAREIRLSRLQTDFVSSVSHELRTPLTSIRLFVETLQSGRLQDPDKVAECLDLLAQETDRLSRMIERVLDWARMEAGRRVYDFEAVAATELADLALTALRSQNLLSDEAIQVEVADDLPLVWADRDAIAEALLNLLQNALKYTPPPRDISLRATASGRGVIIEVDDNGPGIPKQEWSRIFEKFYQGDLRLSSPLQGRIDRGSGLGLSIVRAIVRAHGGRVDLESELGRGSRFRVWLPAAGSVG